MPPADIRLAAHEVARRYGYREVFAKVSLEVRAGEAVLLVGSNGAGKTTLLRVLAGLLRPSAGRVECRVPIGFAGHELMLYEALSARQNLEFFAKLHGVRDRTRVDRLLETFSLAARAGDRLATYSRGMRQRIAIARALLSEPGVLLLDEPFSSLDTEAASAVREVLSSLRRAGTAIVLVSHQFDGLGGFPTRALRMAGGRLEELTRVPGSGNG